MHGCHNNLIEIAQLTPERTKLMHIILNNSVPSLKGAHRISATISNLTFRKITEICSDKLAKLTKHPMNKIPSSYTGCARKFNGF
jgi:hypothetical protein